MKRTIAVHTGLTEARGAVIEDGRVTEWLMSPGPTRLETGMIITGQITDIHDGMDAAFIDIGSDKRGFLHKSELNRPDKGEDVPISRQVTKGAYLLLEVLRPGTDTKGPKLTEKISFSGKYAVYMPFSRYVAVSKKMSSESVRESWRAFGKERLQEDEGLIIRTNAEEEDPEVIDREIDLLRAKADEVKRAFLDQPIKAGAVHVDPSALAARISRDFLADEDTEVICDGRQLYEELVREREVMPLGASVSYTRENVARLYEFERMMMQTVRPYVWLPNGGSLLIEETEAMTVIDVNSGRFTGKENLRKTAYQTNLQAAKVIARELRLREVSGIILIDFIDMDTDDDRKDVLKTLRQGCKQDRTRVNVIGFTSLGLVEMTRKKSRMPIGEIMKEPCGCCGGTGRVDTANEQLYRVSEALQEAVQGKTESLWLDLNVRLYEALTSNQEDWASAIKARIGVRVYVTQSASDTPFQIRMTAESGEIEARLDREEKAWLKL
ncbi:Rne/Rng family ribonuclease [Salisediminibacterium selenitireducens]|uniref:Ribonuclease, Rne/Rng family n=1 Tax=Bacillus selenitireducens (strain ATCC 700615 / DSM 15326 / MLS10) TaxID=439292 RepID=D6XT37_BACIE|nr:Rne/Rng family ribonuclease [Salisediminibacterium selenitireducens]ADH98973.1 ribonuclease, Rne/Rng family [[Bacillus] selenitireducens MLS10]